MGCSFAAPGLLGAQGAALSYPAAATGGKHYIETVWGRGYVLRNPEDESEVAA